MYNEFQNNVYGEDKSETPINTIQYNCRIVENDDAVSLVADKTIIKTDEDGFVEIVPNYCCFEISSYNKASATLSNKDVVKVLGDYRHSFYRAASNFDEVDVKMQEFFPDVYESKEKFDSVVIESSDAVEDFIRRIVFIKNKRLFKVGACILKHNVIDLIEYLDDIDTIEKYCLVMDPDSVRRQLDDGTFKIYGSGKKLRNIMGIPTDIVTRINEYGSADAIPSFQNYLAEEKGSADEIRHMLDWLDALKVLSRKRKITFEAGIDTGTINKIANIIDYGCSITSVINSVSREILMFGADDGSVNDLLREIADTLSMLEKAGFSTNKIGQNLSKWHYITSRNCKIISAPRVEEYTAAVAKINKRSMIMDKWLIKCPETETELFNIGDAYNDCLLIYRDKIIDNGAIIYSMYPLDDNDNPMDCIPPVTFEVTPGLDFVQIKTFNDVDVTDKAVLETLNKWRTAIRRKESHTNG